MIKIALDTKTSLEDFYVFAEMIASGAEVNSENLRDDFVKQVLDEANTAIARLRVQVNQAEAFMESSVSGSAPMF